MMIVEEMMRLTHKVSTRKTQRRQKSQNSLEMQMTAKTFLAVTKAFVIFGWVTKWIWYRKGRHDGKKSQIDEKNGYWYFFRCCSLEGERVIELIQRQF